MLDNLRIHEIGSDEMKPGTTSADYSYGDIQWYARIYNGDTEIASVYGMSILEAEERAKHFINGVNFYNEGMNRTTPMFAQSFESAMRDFAEPGTPFYDER